LRITQDGPPPSRLERYRAWQREHGLIEGQGTYYTMLTGLGMWFYIVATLVGLAAFVTLVLPVILGIAVPFARWWWSVWVPIP